MSNSKKTIITQKGKKLSVKKDKLSAIKNFIKIELNNFHFGYIIDKKGRHFILANLYAKGINGSDKDKKGIAAQKKIAERVLVHFLHEYKDFILSECENYNSKSAYYSKNNKAKNNKSVNNKFYDLVEVFIDIYADKLAKICKENKKLISSYDRNEPSKKIWVPLYFKRFTNYSRNTKGFTPNNTLNQFLKTTAGYLTDHTYNKNTKERLRRCLEAMRYIKSLPNIDAEFKKRYLDKNKDSIAETLLKRLPYDLKKHDKEYYKDLFNLARLFYNINIKDYKLDYLTQGKLGFVFRDDKLYERFIGRILKKCNIEEISENKETTIAIGDNSKAEIKIKPDYVVSKNSSTASKNSSTVPIVLDAKFKDYDKKPDNPDFYQMITYAVHYKSQNTVLIYPRLNGNHDKGIIDTFHLNDIDKKMYIVMLDLLEKGNNQLLDTEYFTEKMKNILDKIN